MQKFLIFSRINTTITVSYPKGLTWHFIDTKAIKMITKVEKSCGHTKTVSINIGLSPNKRFSLMPFLLGMMTAMMLT